MRNQALKLQNTIYVCILYSKTFLHGGFKTKKVVQFQTINHCSAQDWKKGHEKEKLFMAKGQVPNLFAH